MSSFSAAGALDGEELLPIELLECGTTPAGALDHEELLDVELLECGTTPAGALDHAELLHVELGPSCKRVSSKSAGYDCVNNATVPKGRLRHQRACSAGSSASPTPPFRRVDCVINETWPRNRGVGPPRVIRHR